MAFSIGIGLALAVGAFARWFGLDRDRAFYPTVMMVIAFLYVLFAAIGGLAALPVEASIGLGFFALAAIGFKKSPWFVVAALVGHGLFDLVHPHAIANGGVPVWWPDFCSAYDVTAGVWLGWSVYRTRPRVARNQPQFTTPNRAGMRFFPSPCKIRQSAPSIEMKLNQT